MDRADYLEVRGNLAAALIVLQRRREAIEQLQQALRLKPNSVELEINLGSALLESGERQQDIAHYEQAPRRLQPDHTAAHTNLGRPLIACVWSDHGVAQHALRRALPCAIAEPATVGASGLVQFGAVAGRTPRGRPFA